MFDLYQHVTDRILSELEKGVVPWKKPWVGSRFAVSHVTGRPYSLLNQLLLGQPGEYLTIRQANQEGGRVRKGQKSRMVVFWKWIEEEDEDHDGEKSRRPFLRYYSVFHISQCEGIRPRHEDLPPDCVQPHEGADRILDSYWDREKICVVHAPGAGCSYAPESDTITLEARERFISTAEYYSAAFHESIHSTGRAGRLDRLVKCGFGSEPYSMEELIAELGSSFLVNSVGLETDQSLRNSSAYIGNWLHALRDDRRLIVLAAGKAEKAVSFILNINAE